MKLVRSSGHVLSTTSEKCTRRGTGGGMWASASAECDISVRLALPVTGSLRQAAQLHCTREYRARHEREQWAQARQRSEELRASEVRSFAWLAVAGVRCV